MQNKSDFFNLIFIIVSFVLALFIPFQLFLISYAFLGPLHYLTEINWLNKNRFFSTSHFPIYFIGITMLFLSLMALNTHFNFVTIPLQSVSIVSITTYFVFCSFILVLILELFTHQMKLKWYKILLIFGVSIVVSRLTLSGNYSLHLTTFVFVPTLVHVFAFTFLFMWLGYLKKPNQLALLAIIAMLFSPILLFALPDSFYLNFSSTTGTKTYLQSGFELLNKSIFELIDNSTNSDNYFFVSGIGLKIQTFIAFAYTYHYLNWFAKINVIGWAKKISKVNLTIIFCSWIISVSLYWYNYKLGLLVLFFMSLGHVLLEFPLNIKVMKSILKHYQFTIGKVFNP